jgi:PAS domain S-box-containing protein
MPVPGLVDDFRQRLQLNSSTFLHGLRMRLLIADDHEVVRRGVRSLLLEQPGCEVCGEAVNGEEAVRKARELRPDVVVMDISMPDLNGLEATRQIRRLLPDCEVLILSQHEASEMARQALKAGARGYVAKSSISNYLIAALEKVARHQYFFSPEISGMGATPAVFDLQEILQRSATFEQALRESEELYRSTFELAAVGVAHVSPDGRWLRVNRRICEIVGYSEAELLQMKFQDITHPDDLPADLVETEKVVNGTLPMFSMDKRYIRKDGSPIWVSLTVSGARDSNGKLKHFISVVEDISQRREADHTRARLAAIVETSDDAIVSKDLNGIIQTWNSGAVRTFGFTPEEAIGQSITLIIPPEFREEEERILARLRNGERIDHFETVRMTKSGERIDVALTISPLRNSTGKVVGASKIARDITDRKKIEGALRDGRAQLALALESSQTAIFDWDVAARRGAWSPHMAAIYQFQPKGQYVTAEEWRKLFHPEDVDRLAKEAEQVWREKDQFQFEFRTVRPDGEIRWILSHGRVVRDENGSAVRMIGTHMDITARKRVEEELLQRRAELDEAQRLAKVGSWSWDIKTDAASWSDEIYRITGVDSNSSALSFAHLSSLYTPEDCIQIGKTVEDAIRREAEFSLEARLVRPDGSKRWVVVKGQPQRDLNGGVAGFRGSLQDITDRKQVEEQLRQGEERTRFSLEAADVGTWEWDVQEGTVHWSGNMEAVHGQAPGSFTGTFDSFLENVFAEDRPAVTQQIEAAFSGSGKYQIEYRNYRADGSLGRMQANGQVVFDDSGKPLRMFGICANITERKLAEEAVKASESRLSAAFGQTYSFLVLLELDGTILEANRAALEAAGSTREQVVGRKFWEPWWAPLPDEVEILKEGITKAAQGQLVRGECWFCLADGTRRFADRSLSPVYDEKGKVVMIVASGLDLTEQKELRDKLEERVWKRTRELEEKNKALLEHSGTVRELTAKLLHAQDEERRRLARELHDSAGQMLAALQMNLVPMELQAQQTNPDFCKALRQSIDIVDELSKELRTVSYLLHPPLLDEAGLSSALRWYVEGFSERSKIAVQLELPPGLGRLPQEMEMTIFRLVQESLTNIHRHSGSQKATIHLQRSAEEIAVEIRDEGKGMPGLNQDGSATRSGVGIQGMRERVRQLGGQFEIQSDQSGTTVITRLPLSAGSLVVA